VPVPIPDLRHDSWVLFVAYAVVGVSLFMLNGDTVARFSGQSLPGLTQVSVETKSVSTTFPKDRVNETYLRQSDSKSSASNDTAQIMLGTLEVRTPYRVAPGDQRDDMKELHRRVAKALLIFAVIESGRIKGE
jgi:hypothetical protein